MVTQEEMNKIIAEVEAGDFSNFGEVTLSPATFPVTLQPDVILNMYDVAEGRGMTVPELIAETVTREYATA